MICNLPRYSSDHAPILLQMVGAMVAGTKPFRFESFWTQDESSKVVVAGAWNICMRGSLPFRLVQCIKSTKQALKR